MRDRQRLVPSPGLASDAFDTLDATLRNLEAAAAEEVPEALLRLGVLASRVAALQSALAARVLALSGARPAASEPDRYLSVAETAKFLGVCQGYVYDHQSELPVVRMGRRVLFSAVGLQRYIAARSGTVTGRQR